MILDIVQMSPDMLPSHLPFTPHTANLRTKILDFRRFDSNRILIVRGGILGSIGDFPEIPNQRTLVRGLSARGLTVPLPAEPALPAQPAGGCTVCLRVTAQSANP